MWISLFGGILLFTTCSTQPNSLEILHLGITSSHPISWSEKTPCELSYYSGFDTIQLPASIKFRGGMSSKYWKHSYSMELNTPFQFPGLKPDDDFILNANYIDRSFIRHTLSFDLFRQMDKGNVAPYYQYAQLSLNNKPQGLYVLMEKLNAGSLSIQKKDNNAAVYKDPGFFKDSLIPPSSISSWAGLKWPKTLLPSTEHHIQELMHFIWSSSEEEFAKHFESWFQFNTILDWHLLLLLSNNSDGLLKNFYLYKKSSNTPYSVAIWDYDHSFGRDGDSELNMLSHRINCSRSILFRRLLRNPYMNYPDQLARRWVHHQKSGVLTPRHIHKRIQTLQLHLDTEIAENEKWWPSNGKWYLDSANFNMDIELIKHFIDLRWEELNQRFKQK